jgi:hypothetical protein
MNSYTVATSASDISADNLVMMKFVATDDKNFPKTYLTYENCFKDVLSKSDSTATPTTDAEK